MRVAAFGVILSTFGLGVAEAAQAPDAIQYGALAILAGLVYATLRALKEDRDAFLKAQSDERKTFHDSLDATRHDFCDSLERISRAVDLLTTKSEARRPDGR